MKHLALLLALSFFTLTLSARDIIKDPEFKKKDKYWHLQVTGEYKSVKPKFKKGEVSFKITHTSEHYYVSYVSEAPVKKGKTYQIRFKFKGDGQGKIYITQRNYPNIFKGKRFDARKDKLINLGLIQSFEPKAEWQEATCTFIAKENPQSHLIEALILMMGSYQGEVTFSDLSYVELKDSKITPKEHTGNIEVSLAK